MNPEFWAVIGVGVALAGLQMHIHSSLKARLGRIEAVLTSIKERLSRIEGWTAGRFGEELSTARLTPRHRRH